MTDEMNKDFRLGSIRIGRLAWERFGEKIKAILSEEGQIVNILPALRNGQYTTAVDVIMFHPEMEPVRSTGAVNIAGEPVRIYTCSFSENPDGTIIRGPLIAHQP